MVVHNFEDGKTLVVDIAVINPFGESHRKSLHTGDAGYAATMYEMKKRKLYKDLDFSKYIFFPFVLECSGALGDAALELISMIHEISIEEKPQTQALSPGALTLSCRGKTHQ